MDNTFTQPAPVTDAEYEAEFEKALAEIRQYEATFDRTQAEIVMLREEGARIMARGDVLQAEIDGLINKIRGPR